MEAWILMAGSLQEHQDADARKWQLQKSAAPLSW